MPGRSFYDTILTAWLHFILFWVLIFKSFSLFWNNFSPYYDLRVTKQNITFKLLFSEQILFDFLIVAILFNA